VEGGETDSQPKCTKNGILNCKIIPGAIPRVGLPTTATLTSTPEKESWKSGENKEKGGRRERRRGCTDLVP